MMQIEKKNKNRKDEGTNPTREKESMHKAKASGRGA